MNKLAITGITGKSGKFLFEELVKKSDEVLENWREGVKFLIRAPEKASFINVSKLSFPIEFVCGDLTDKDTAIKLLKGCDTCLHIAGIRSSLNVLQAAIKNKVKRLILVHTTGIYSKYKEAGEEYRKIDSRVYELAEKYEIKLTILRPTMVYGTVDDKNISVFIKMVDKLKIMPTVNGAHYELQPVHCADLGKAFYQVLMNPEKCNGNDYILSGGNAIELRQIFDEIVKNLGVKRIYISCPFPIAYAGAWVIWILTLKKKDYREKVQRLCEPRIFSHEDATKDFNYMPRMFQDGIIQEVRDYIRNKNK